MIGIEVRKGTRAIECSMCVCVRERQSVCVCFLSQHSRLFLYAWCIYSFREEHLSFQPVINGHPELGWCESEKASERIKKRRRGEREREMPLRLRQVEPSHKLAAQSNSQRTNTKRFSFIYISKVKYPGLTSTTVSELADYWVVVFLRVSGK